MISFAELLDDDSSRDMRARLNSAEVLADVPQHRALLQLFEEEASELLDWSLQLREAVHLLAESHARAATASSKVASLLSAYSGKRFALEDTQMDIAEISTRLGGAIQNISGNLDVLSSQIANCVSYPISKMCKELQFLVHDGRLQYKRSRADALECEERHLKASRKEQPKKLDELKDDLEAAQAEHYYETNRYCGRLNVAQLTRYTLLFEPLHSLLYAFRALFSAGHEALRQPDLATFLALNQKKMHEIAKECNRERALTHEDLLDKSSRPRANKATPPTPTKQGYLRVKMKSNLFMHAWERFFVFIQDGQLMWQKPSELASTRMLTLQGATVSEAADVERRFVLSVEPKSGTKEEVEKQWFLQALDEEDMSEWIASIASVAESSAESVPSKTATAASSKEKTHSSRETSAKLDQTEEREKPIQFDHLSLGQLPSNFDEVDEASAEDHEVCFLGSTEIELEKKDSVVQETIDKVIGMRKHFQIESGQSLRLLCRGERLLMRDGNNRSTLKAFFDFSDIALWMQSSVDPRQFAIVSREHAFPDENAFTCHVYQSECGADSIFRMLEVETTKAFMRIQKKVQPDCTERPAETEDSSKGES